MHLALEEPTLVLEAAAAHSAPREPIQAPVRRDALLVRQVRTLELAKDHARPAHLVVMLALAAWVPVPSVSQARSPPQMEQLRVPPVQ